MSDKKIFDRLNNTYTDKEIFLAKQLADKYEEVAKRNGYENGGSLGNFEYWLKLADKECE